MTAAHTNTPAQQAAHHQRLLAKLLTQLTETATTHWLGPGRHPTKHHNTSTFQYRRGIYLLEDLAPIQDLLADLRSTGHQHSGDMPAIHHHVDRLRLSSKPQASSKRLTQEQARTLLQTWISRTQAALETLQANTDQPDQPSKTAAQLLNDLHDAQHRLSKDPGATFRHRHITTRHHVRIYQHDGETMSDFVRSIGMILTGDGHIPTLERAQARKPRSRETAPPIATYHRHSLHIDKDANHA